eukprot:12431500-Karenia_brevis.AAC.2
MHSRAFSPNLVSFNAGISACKRGGQWQRAAPLFNEMRSSYFSLRDEMHSCDAAISAFEKVGQWQCLVPLCNAMRGDRLSI